MAEKSKPRKRGGKKFFTRERVLFIVGILLFLFVLAAFAWSVNFLRTTILPALTGEGVDDGDIIQFNTEAYDELGLEESEVVIIETAPTTEEAATTTADTATSTE